MITLQRKSQSTQNKQTSQWHLFLANCLFTISIVGVALIVQAEARGVTLLQRASAASVFTYQGYLANQADQPVSGEHDIVFAVYDAPEAGALLWGPEAHDNMPIDNGFVSADVGSITAGGIPSGLLSGGEYLEVTLDGETLAPRIAMTNVQAGVSAESIVYDSSFDLMTWKLSAEDTFTADGGVSTRRTYDTGITLTVPDGEKHVYLATYDGRFTYRYHQRQANKETIYGYWQARIMNGDEMLDHAFISNTGYSLLWNSVGGNSYWNDPFQLAYVLELDPGTYDLAIAIHGYSDNRMDFANLLIQRFEVLRMR